MIDFVYCVLETSTGLSLRFRTVDVGDADLLYSCSFVNEHVQGYVTGRDHATVSAAAFAVAESLPQVIGE